MKKLATMALATVVATSAFAATKTMGDEGKKWTINVGLGFPQGDHKDAGVDNQVMLGADYHMGMFGDSGMATSYLGLMYMFGSGDGDLDTRTYGVHYGVIFPLDDKGNTPLSMKIQAGYYNTELSAGSAEADKWALGGKAAFVWAPKNQKWNLEAGMFWMPKVDSVDNRGWFVGVNFPFGG